MEFGHRRLSIRVILSAAVSSSDIAGPLNIQWWVHLASAVLLLRSCSVRVVVWWSEVPCAGVVCGLVAMLCVCDLDRKC